MQNPGHVIQPRYSYLICTMLHGGWHSRGHELVQGLQGVVDGQTVSKPRHDPGVGPLIHLTGQEEGVAPQAGLHGKLQALLLVPVKQVGTELRYILVLQSSLVKLLD